MAWERIGILSALVFGLFGTILSLKQELDRQRDRKPRLTVEIGWGVISHPLVGTPATCNLTIRNGGALPAKVTGIHFEAPKSDKKMIHIRSLAHLNLPFSVPSGDSTEWPQRISDFKDFVEEVGLSYPCKFRGVVRLATGAEFRSKWLKLDEAGSRLT